MGNTVVSTVHGGRSDRGRRSHLHPSKDAAFADQCTMEPKAEGWQHAARCQLAAYSEEKEIRTANSSEVQMAFE